MSIFGKRKESQKAALEAVVSEMERRGIAREDAGSALAHFHRRTGAGRIKEASDLYRKDLVSPHDRTAYFKPDPMTILQAYVKDLHDPD